MTMKEKILMLPAWKAGIIFLLMSMLILFALEEVFLSKIFNLFDRQITYFENTFKEEASEYDRDYQENQEREAYHEVESNILKLEFEFVTDFTEQWDNCRRVKINKLRHQEFDLPYVKKDADTKERIIQEIKHDQTLIDDAIKNNRFDPSKCEVK